MPLGQCQRVVAPQGPQKRDPDSPEPLADRLQVGFGAQAVQDHAPKVDLPVVLPKPQGRRRCTLSHGAHVDHQDDGKPQDLRYLRTAADSPAPPVVEPHDPLRHGDVGPAGGPDEEGRHGPLVGQPSVQIADRTVPRQPMMAGIDVVGADLVPANTKSPPAQGGQKPADDRRLARTAPGCRDEDSGNTTQAVIHIPGSLFFRPYPFIGLRRRPFRSPRSSSVFPPR